MMLIAVVDGQGGGIGKAIIERLWKELPDANVIALGTNPYAAASMLKAGADRAAFGETEMIRNISLADLIIGPLGILAGGSMKGELTDAVALAIAHRPVRKILIPLEKCGMEIAGIDKTSSVQRLIDSAVALI